MSEALPPHPLLSLGGGLTKKPLTVILLVQIACPIAAGRMGGVAKLLLSPGWDF